MKKLIIANWKCNPTTLKEAQKMLAGLKAGIKNNKAEVVACPPFVYLSIFNRLSAIKLGAQNCFWENSGAFTGEVSPKMLKDLGVNYVILGHSERIMAMGETNEMTAKKVKAVLDLGLLPVVCVGETLEEKEQGKTFPIVESEFRESLKSINKQQVEKVIVAYEPLWAISTNQALVCSSDDALTMALFIKKLTGEIYGKKAKENIKVLYGGNVSSSNASSYLENPAIDGLLAGGASLNIKEFIAMVKNI